MDIQKYVEQLTARALANEAETQPLDAPERLEAVLKGRTIELWSDAAGGLFLVADETDAKAAIDCHGARRGDVYTAAEARRIVAVGDPTVVAEIHEWKRRFDGVVREIRTR